MNPVPVNRMAYDEIFDGPGICLYICCSPLFGFVVGKNEFRMNFDNMPVGFTMDKCRYHRGTGLACQKDRGL